MRTEKKEKTGKYMMKKKKKKKNEKKSNLECGWVPRSSFSLFLCWSGRDGHIGWRRVVGEGGRTNAPAEVTQV